MAIKVVAIDLDGTLLPRATVSHALARWLGHEDQLLRLEEHYAACRISNKDVAVETAQMFRGLEIAAVEHELDRLAVIRDLDATLDMLRARGVRTIVASVTWSFAARYFCRRYGFDAYCGTEMEESENRLSGRVKTFFDEFDKRNFVEAYCKGLQLSHEHCAAIGDSRSDLPLFGWAAYSIAFNATPVVRRSASACIDSDSLLDVVPHLLRYGLPEANIAQR